MNGVEKYQNHLYVVCTTKRCGNRMNVRLVYAERRSDRSWTGGQRGVAPEKDQTGTLRLAFLATAPLGSLPTRPTMKAIVVIALLSACVLAVSAAASCDAAGAKCIGPVTGTYTDDKCKTLVGTSLERVFSDDTTAQSGGKCIEIAADSSSAKWNCGSRLAQKSYSQPGCKGPSTVFYSYPTGKCVQIANDPSNVYSKIMCASASTVSFSAALVALLALIALLF